MIINVHGGHNGNAPGAVGLISEVDEDRKVKNLVIAGLREMGHIVYDCTHFGQSAGLTKRNDG